MMAQHLWVGTLIFRFCGVCEVRQYWAPPVSPICPGDDDDGGRPSARPSTPAECPI